MKFESNRCMAIHLPDLAQAESFYHDVLGFKLVSKSAACLEFDTGSFLFYINLDPKSMPPIPSFTVANIEEARELLKKNGCIILDDREGSFYFKDPFGLIYDVIED